MSPITVHDNEMDAVSSAMGLDPRFEGWEVLLRWKGKDGEVVNCRRLVTFVAAVTAVDARRVKSTHRDHLDGRCPNVLRGIVWNGVESPKGKSSSSEEGDVRDRGGMGGNAAADAAGVERTIQETPTTKKTKPLSPELEAAPWNRRVAASAGRQS